MVEVYRRSRCCKISKDFELVLEGGWNQVFRLLVETGVGEIVGFERLEVSLVDDDEMAEVHREFLGDATPTDVITFEHGEILIGVETAIRQAEEFRTSPDREVALYGIHGMLHLAGFDDREVGEAEVMARRQDELLEVFFGEVFGRKRFFSGK